MLSEYRPVSLSLPPSLSLSLSFSLPFLSHSLKHNNAFSQYAFKELSTFLRLTLSYPREGKKHILLRWKLCPHQKNAFPTQKDQKKRKA
jgi:hypothetical protein